MDTKDKQFISEKNIYITQDKAISLSLAETLAKTKLLVKSNWKSSRVYGVGKGEKVLVAAWNL